jgi:integrase
VRFNPIPSNPAKIKQDGITPLDSEQARALLDAGKEGRLEALYVLYVLSLTVGLRIGEALGLKWSDIDLYTGTLCVNRQLQWYTGKGLVFSEPEHGSRRTVDLPQRTVEALRSHRKRQVERREEASVASQQTPTERPQWRRLFEGGQEHGTSARIVDRGNRRRCCLPASKP